jgi:hypothetical protein
MPAAAPAGLVIARAAEAVHHLPAPGEEQDDQKQNRQHHWWSLAATSSTTYARFRGHVTT